MRRGARPQHSLPCALLNLPPPPSPLAPGPAAQTRISGALHWGWRGSSSHEARPSRRAAPQPRQDTDPLTHNSSPLRTRRDDEEDDDEECEACETVPEHVKKKVASPTAAGDDLLPHTKAHLKTFAWPDAEEHNRAFRKRRSWAESYFYPCQRVRRPTTGREADALLEANALGRYRKAAIAEIGWGPLGLRAL